MSNFFQPALELLPKTKGSDNAILTKEFLELCVLILPMIDAFGSALSLVKSDIGGNIKRLQKRYDSNPELFRNLFSIVRSDIDNNVALLTSSDTNALIWLTRAMDFCTSMFQNLQSNSDWTLYQCAYESYVNSLQQYHGWIAQGAFKLALNLIPSRENFLNKIGKNEVDQHLDTFLNQFCPILIQIQNYLNENNLNVVKAT